MAMLDPPPALTAAAAIAEDKAVAVAAPAAALRNCFREIIMAGHYVIEEKQEARGKK
jgi:hypothetical protein